MRVLYIATSAYPGDNPYATRIHGICQALQKTGVSTDVLTDYSNLDIGSFEYQGSSVHVGAKHCYKDRTVVDKILASVRMYNNLRKILKRTHYDCVIVSSMYIRIKKIMKIIKDFHLPIILESCEWFEAYNWRKGEKSFLYKQYVKAWNESSVKVDGVIAISRLLENHYREFVPNVIRIPTIMKVQEKYNNLSENAPVKLIFTGSIEWGKDRLVEVINAIDLIREEKRKIELHIYGPTKESVVSQLGSESILNRNKDRIFIHGRISHEDVVERCKESDFGVILRPNRRQSNAGFPTKLAEYMSAGASVIANDTGDIGLYIQNGMNGFLLPVDYTVDRLKEILTDIIDMGHESVIQMKKNAYETACKSFNYISYSDVLRSFIENVIVQHKNL